MIPTNVPLSSRVNPHYPKIPHGKPRRRINPPKLVENSISPPPIDTSLAQNPRFKQQAPQSHRPTIRLSPAVADAPVSPQDALNTYSSFLTNFEKNEILSFPEIYFVGNRTRKIEPNHNDRYNIGFDDRGHNYKIIIGDHLAYRFEVVRSLGSGAFGQVVLAIDHKTKTNVAVKIVVNTDQMHEQGQIEAKILARLNKSNTRNVVRAYDFFIFRSHICITYEVLGKNLYELSQANNFRALNVHIVKGYARQILEALENCQTLGIVHCDIKPENILIQADNRNQVKLIDFGSGCFENHQKYEYIQSRFYRAPEVILGISYGPPMDIWSFALVIVEMLLGRPLFPGDDELEELTMIAEVLGNPPSELVKLGKRKREFFDSTGKLKARRGKPRRAGSMPIQSALKSNDPFYCDFISKCLTWDQKVRLTATQALQHPWLNMKEVQIIPPKQPHTMLPDLNK